MHLPRVLNILHVTDGNRGGSQRHVIDLCRAGTPDVRHFVLHVAADSLSIHDAAGGRLLVLASPAPPGGLAALLRIVIAELAIDCVHAHALPVLLAAVESADHPLGATPLLITLHDLGCIDPQLFSRPGPDPRPDSEWIARCTPVLRAARALIVPSGYLARQVRTHYRDAAPLVIPNGIAEAPAAALPIAPPWPAGARVFAVVGALGPHKGSDTLLRVAGALKSPDIVGVVIGYTDTRLTPGWLVPGRLHVHGRYAADEVPGLLGGYGVRLAYFPNVVPESFSYALSEVWQAGIPALAPATGALGDRVRAAGAGWLLDDPLDALAAAAAIERLLGPDGAAELADARAKLGRPASCVPAASEMRAEVYRLYRSQAGPPQRHAGGGWVRLRTVLRPELLASAEDCALDAEWPALVRDAHTLRGWNGKLTRDLATIEATARRAQAELAESLARSHGLEREVLLLKSRNDRIEADAAALSERNLGIEHEIMTQKARNAELEHSQEALRRSNPEIEGITAALRERNAQVEAETVALSRRNARLEGDMVTLTQRNIELDSAIVELKERNTLVEADLFALKQRNTRVEREAAALHSALAIRHGRTAQLEQELARTRDRAARFERALTALPAIIHNRLLRHAG